jgi:hypothetical protein
VAVTVGGGEGTGLGLFGVVVAGLEGSRVKEQFQETFYL